MQIKNKNFYYSEYFKTIDGNYNSFWVGKLIKKFIKAGKKLLIEKKFSKYYWYIKIFKKKTLYVLLLEKLEKIKPIFKIKSKLIAGKLREYPAILDNNKSRNYAIHDIYTSIINKKDRKINQKIINELLDTDSKNNLLVKKIKEFNSSIENRFNVRFSRPRIKRR